MSLFSWFKREPKPFSVDIHKFPEFELLFPGGQEEMNAEFKKLETQLSRSGWDFFMPMLLVVNGLFFLEHEVKEEIPSIRDYILKQKNNKLSPTEAAIIGEYVLIRTRATEPDAKFKYISAAMERNLGIKK